MSSAVPSEVKFEIGHVLFIDIVGYSKLLITGQSEQLETLRTGPPPVTPALLRIDPDWDNLAAIPASKSFARNQSNKRELFCSLRLLLPERL